MSEKNTAQTAQMEVTAAEKKVLEVAREIDFGQLVVTVKGGAPVYLDEVRRTVPLK